MCARSRPVRARAASLAAAVAVVVAIALSIGTVGALARTAPPAPTTPAKTTPSTTTTGSTTQNFADAGDSDLVNGLGGTDPFCPGGQSGISSAFKVVLNATQLEDCKVSGSASEPFPISSYELDVQTPNVDAKSLLTGGAVVNYVGYALESAGAVAWEILLYLVKGVLLLVQEGYALNLLGVGMGGVKSALAIMQNRVLGTVWMEIALTVLGLWAIWNGLVRRKTIETVSGLLTTVAMMVVSLVMITQPQNTIGKLSQYADQASLTALSATESAKVSNPGQALASAEGSLWTGLVLRPWCALEFGNVPYCTQQRTDVGKSIWYGVQTSIGKKVAKPPSMSVAQVWLSTPANSPTRTQLYSLAATGKAKSTTQKVWSILESGFKAATGDYKSVVQNIESLFSNGPNLCGKASSCPAADILTHYIVNQPQHVEIQGGGGNVFDRLTLLAMVMAGLVGALLLLFYIAIKLLFAAVKTMLLILGLPVMMLVAAFGESGRATHGSYLKRLVGALVTKLVFSLVLAIVLLTARTIEDLPIGWFPQWLLMIVFWWGVYLERKELLKFLEFNHRAVDNGMDIGGRNTPFRLASTLMAARSAVSLVRGGVGLARTPFRAAQQHGYENRLARSEAARENFGQQLRAQAAGVIRGEDEARAATARARVGAYERDERNLAAMKGDQGRNKAELQRINRELREGNLSNLREGQLENDRAVLERQLEGLPNQIADAEMDLRQRQPEVNDDRKFLREMAQRNRADDPQEQRRMAEQRQQDVLNGPFPDESNRPAFERALRWAQIDPQEYYAQDGAPGSLGRVRRTNMAASAQAAWVSHQQAFSQVDSPAARQHVAETGATLRAWETGRDPRSRAQRRADEGTPRQDARPPRVAGNYRWQLGRHRFAGEARRRSRSRSGHRGG